MPKTRKNVKTSKKEKKNLEDLVEDKKKLEFELESETESDYSSSDYSSSDTETEYDDTSISKELNEMMNGTIDSVKDGDLTIPVIGLGLIAMIGFAIYKGVKI